MSGLVDDIQPFNIGAERILHSDRYMAQVREDIPGFLKRYFNFPNDEYPERLKVYSPILGREIETVEHVVVALQAMFRGGKQVKQWATDHCKSDTLCFFFPILSLADDPDEAHILLCANFQDAKRRLQKVQRELEAQGPLIADYPWLKKPERTRYAGGLTWSRTELTIAGRSANRANPSLYAAALGSDDVRQRRGKLLGDDVEGEEHRRLASKRQQLYDFIKLEAIRCWEDHAESRRPLLCFAGTPYDMDSVYRKLEDEDWEVSKVPAYTVTYDHISRAPNLRDGSSSEKLPWEERAKMIPDRYYTWPRKRFKVAAQDPKFGKGMTLEQFSISYLLDPSAGNPSRLDFKTIRKLVEDVEFDEESEDAWITLGSIDPAGGVGQDYAGISAMRIRWPKSQKFPDVEILEATKFEQGLFEQVDFAADMCWRHTETQKGAFEGRPARLVYENNALQGATYRNAFQHKRPEIRLVPYYTSAGAKFDTEMGLTVIRTLVREHKLKVMESQIETEGVQTLLREIRDLGSNAHDHISASIWFVVRWIYAQVRGANAPQYDNPQNAKRFNAAPRGFFHPRVAVGGARWRR